MPLQITDYHAKYFAHDLTRQSSRVGLERLSMALFDANVDLNPHQIEAALFALRSPVSKGVILADGVGLDAETAETFNWLLGLSVHTIDVIRGFHVVTGRLPGPGNDENGEKALNGDNYLQNQNRDDQTWKVRVIEEEFHRLMWDVEDV